MCEVTDLMNVCVKFINFFLNTTFSLCEKQSSFLCGTKMFETILERTQLNFSCALRVRLPLYTNLLLDVKIYFDLFDVSVNKHGCQWVYSSQWNLMT